MRIRKWVALAATASIALWAPSVVPIKAYAIGCAFNGYQTADTAYATGVDPCLVAVGGHGPSPWPVVVVFAGVVSVMANAAWIWRTAVPRAEQPGGDDLGLPAVHRHGVRRASEQVPLSAAL